MNTFKNAEYTITTSLSDQSASIYVKIANNISYAAYEGTFEKSAFRLSFEIAGIYSLINKCFAAFTDCGGFKSPYTVTMELESSMMMRLAFNCMLEGIIAVEFELRLQQKIVQGDAILSVELEKQNQLIERLIKRLDSAEKMIELQNNKIAGLEKLTKTVEKNIGIEIQCMNEQNVARMSEIDKIERIIDCMGNGLYVELRRADTTTEHHLINSTKLLLSCCFGNLGPSRLYVVNEFEKIRAFYNLVELTVDRVGFDFKRQSNPSGETIIFNSSLKKFSITNSCSSVWSDFSIIKQFPNLEELYISNPTSNGVTPLQVTEALNTLKTTPHKLKKITFEQVSNAHGLQSYCDKNGIELIIK